MDVLDAQWGREGELIPLDPSDLNPREFLVYQHGLFLMDAMNALTLVSVSPFTFNLGFSKFFLHCCFVLSWVF